MSISKGKTLLVLLGLVLSAPVGTQSSAESDSPSMVHHYLLPIEHWSGGMSLDAPRRFASLEVGLIGRNVVQPPRGSGVSTRVRCVADLDSYVLNSISELEPEALWPLTQFYFEVFIVHATTGQRWLASEARRRYRSVLKRYSQRSKPSDEARRRHSRLLVAIAGRLSSQGFLALNEMARQAAGQAVSLTPQSASALYWAAFLEEKSGRYEEALDLLTRLTQERGDDPEILVRRGVNLARRGRVGDGRADFESVARGTGDDVWRILAYQELAQFDSEAGAPRAVAVLEEALAVFPDDQGLRLLASFHGLPVDPLDGEVARSPRLRYEMVRQDELDTVISTWKSAAGSRLGGLSSSLVWTRARLVREEKAVKACRDVVPR